MARRVGLAQVVVALFDSRCLLSIKLSLGFVRREEETNRNDSDEAVKEQGIDFPIHGASVCPRKRPAGSVECSGWKTTEADETRGLEV